MTTPHIDQENQTINADFFSLYESMYTTVSVETEHSQVYNPEELSLEVV